MNFYKFLLFIVTISFHQFNYSEGVDNIQHGVSDKFEGRFGFGGTGGEGGNVLGNIDSVFGSFWHTLYINRGFNSSFVFIVPMFTITIPGYGRGMNFFHNKVTTSRQLLDTRLL